ncbi:phosphatase PAP2 family protein [Mangrovihabitans endophyticus]|uniref:Phosphatidic acid phosphatase type 2/haloperoxidase domain-containing protein n=1 Tax=Mangrovihabitans endophyticus TaxID=1751298 RepID=A0A8J3FSH8_9ACTN|nr:phosphatase PAP2 family protein [Mangrovihabitans endophyticus]GGL17397.1 hypothetical protein GCM10012284_59930 [Mangrovihabitans endophyticus]
MTALAERPTVATPPHVRGARHVITPVLVMLAAAAGVAGIYRVFVGTSLGQTVDTIALRGADVSHPKITEVLSRTLNGTTLVSLVLVCLAAAGIGVVRKRVDLAIGAAMLVIGANLTSQVLKTRLPRPDLDGFPAPNSFPSGHTTAAASVAFALVLVLPHAIRGTVALAGAAYVTVIAVATVWAEWHRPSDTVAALLVALSWGALASAVLRLRPLVIPPRASRLATLPFVLVAAVAGTAGAAGLAAVTSSQRWAPDLLSGRFTFLTAAACILAAVAAVFLVWTRLAAGDTITGTTSDPDTEPDDTLAD